MPEKKLINFRFSVTISFVLFALIMQINGIIHIWPDSIKICNSIMLDSFGSQLSMRLVGRFIHDDEQNVLDIQEIIDEFYENEEKLFERQNFLTSRVMLIDVAVKYYMLINGILFHIPIITSVIISIYFQDFIPSAPFYVPFVDPDQLQGFVVNEILMAFTSTMMFMLLIVMDLTYFYYALQSIPIGDIFVANLKEFEESLNKLNDIESKSYRGKNIQKPKSKNTVLDLSKKQIVKLITDFNNYNNFLSLLITYMHMPSLSIISTNAIAIGLSILVALFFSIPIGISMGLIFLLQILLPCIEGAIISHQNEKILNAVWEFPWYELSTTNQKIWLQFLHQCQNANEYKVMIFGRVNMELFANAIKTAYSTLMFFLELV